MKLSLIILYLNNDIIGIFYMNLSDENKIIDEYIIPSHGIFI